MAPTDFTVLITGESGVGKEIFPRIIHSFSTRKHAQYIAVNCGGIPEGTIDSELFGHEKGSFTGALSDRKGYFEVSDGGTIFLDEVGELPLSTQAKLLRVLEAGEFIRVGSSKVQKTNVRVMPPRTWTYQRLSRTGSSGKTFTTGSTRSRSRSPHYGTGKKIYPSCFENSRLTSPKNTVCLPSD